MKQQDKTNKTKESALGLWELICFIGFGIITYVLYFEGSPFFKGLAVVTALKAIEIAYKRFLK